MTTAPAPSRHPLDGPFMTAVQLADYRDEPGYAILPARAAEAGRMAREDRKD